MKTPGFWYARRGTTAWLLSPLGCFQAGATALRLKFGKRKTVGLPVVCVGNLVAGGAGKTPTALAIAQRLESLGVSHVHHLSRGHGGRLHGPLRVDPDVHSAADVGDEPLLMARRRPTWIARDRTAGAEAARGAGAQALVLDDGFQNPALRHDLSLVVIDGAVGFGNGLVIPAGPLREPVSSGLARADALVIVGSDRTRAAKRAPDGLPILNAALTPRPDSALTPSGEEPPTSAPPVVAFAGLGRPQKFFDTLEAMGLRVIDAIAYPDHHPYSRTDLDHLEALASTQGARLVTTEKDATRLPADMLKRIDVVAVEIRWADPDALDRLLDPIVRRAHG